MPQTSLGLLAAGLASGLLLSWPSDLAATHAHGLAGVSDTRRAEGCQAGDGRCRTVTPAQESSPDDGFGEVTVADGLGGCTPFLAIDGERELDFDTAHGAVVEVATPSGPQQSGGAPPATAIGTFSTSDRTGQVVIVLAGVRREYTLIIPADGTQCILALGPPHAVNLERSWFGQISDDADLDPPTYERAAAPRFHGERGSRRPVERAARPA